jgi:hypothetical protein
MEQTQLVFVSELYESPLKKRFSLVFTWISGIVGNINETHNTRICRNSSHLGGERSESKSKAGSIELEDVDESVVTRFATRTTLSGERLAGRLPVVFDSDIDRVTII